MHQLRLFKLLLTPSFSSVLVALLSTSFLLASGNVDYLVQNQFLNDYASLEPQQLAALLDSWQQEVAAGAIYIFDRPEVYLAAIALAAALIGLLVFACLEIVTRSAFSVHDDWEQIAFTQGTVKTRVEQEIGLRWLIRISATLLWIFYWGFWLSTLLLFSILLVRAGLGKLPASSGISTIFLGTLMLALSIHIHVIFARLVTLRPRLFGGLRAIETTLFER